MLTGQPSRTIMLPAILRAAHQILDQPPIFTDPVAIDLLPETSERAILAATDDLRSPHMTRLRALMALRSRFAEDRLAAATVRGIRQHVILAAGLETFPWRQPPFTRDMQIFAVDHPATLAWTKQRMQERGLLQPLNLTRVPADLEEQRLGQQLVALGFADHPTFCSALGLAQYLTDAAVNALLRFAASLPSGSELVLSFVVGDEDLSGDDLAIARTSIAGAEAKGEPWRTRMRPEEIISRFHAVGFADVFHLKPELGQDRYFAGRLDGLRAPRWEQLIAAVT